MLEQEREGFQSSGGSSDAHKRRQLVPKLGASGLMTGPKIPRFWTQGPRV
jgi:hypothetical protein